MIFRALLSIERNTYQPHMKNNIQGKNFRITPTDLLCMQNDQLCMRSIVFEDNRNS